MLKKDRSFQDSHNNITIPSIFDKSAVRSERLKFHGIWDKDLSESLECPTPLSGGSSNPTELVKSDVKAVSRTEVSTPILGISDALNGKWPLDATEVGLTGISDMDDIALFRGIVGDMSAIVVSITILQNQECLV